MPPISEWLDAAPLVIAHRGASFWAPENTLPAFEMAVTLGADAVELDAKLSRDGRVVAFHDQTLLRTTGRSGRPMDLSAAELVRLDAGSWKSPQYRQAGVPELDQILEAVGRRVLVNVELTDYTRRQAPLVGAVVEAVRRHGLERRVLLSSFDSLALRTARALAPEIPLAHLRGPTWLSLQDLVRRPLPAPDADHLHVSLTGRAAVAAAHRVGRRFHAYTVDRPEAMSRLWSWGVDGLITNVPEVAVRERDSR